jgi:periplasmic divalent cation tolerance protein
MEKVVVFVTAPSEEEAAGIARTLVEERLAACVNIVRGIRSIYSWEGRVEDDTEMLLIVKTRAALFDRLATRVKELHSYTVPEVIAVPLVKGLKDYTDWIGEVTAD